MEFRDWFDAVVMLTWSDWASEPRSNRYHYATRFAKLVPTFFVQTTSSGKNECIGVRADLESSDLNIVELCLPVSACQIEQVRLLLASYGVKRPLLWIYDSINYAELLKVYPQALRVYHATESYFTASVAMELTTADDVTSSIRRLLPDIDLVVAVSERVAHSLVENTSYGGRIIIAENGCDYAYFSALADAAPKTADASPLTVVYQGALNTRIDYDLLCAIVKGMPNARFRFFGRVSAYREISRLSALQNVEILGPQAPDVFGRGMIEATVGIIPFIQDQLIRDSLPLKAYEYVACGLPVVTVPIDALLRNADHGVFDFASTAEQFIASITRVARTRFDPVHLESRDRIAKASSYDERFDTVIRELVSLAEKRSRSTAPLNVGMLVDGYSLHVGTIVEHIAAFERYSRNSITLLPATFPGDLPPNDKQRFNIDLSMFDVLIVHYTVRISLPSYLDADYADALEKFSGLKVLFIQDEYDNVECTRSWMDRIGFDLVYTCVPPSQRHKVYPDYRYPATDFLPTLTGFVPEHPDLDEFALPLEARGVAVAYRGRDLPAIYGMLGHEKYRIGIEFKARAESAGLTVDIDCDSASRIYGDDWYRFLGSARATLGTESGSNVFDFDGSLAVRIRQLQIKQPEISFDEIWGKVLAEHEGSVRMNQISPKIFEAIRLRTALILFEGDYSGVVRPDLHFIPLRKDFSNFDEVIAKLSDDAFVRRITKRAFEDVIESGRYSYRRFVEDVDEQLRWRTLHRQQRNELYGLAVISFDEAGSLKQCLPMISLPLRYSRLPFERGESFHGLQRKIQRAFGRPGNVAVLDAADVPVADVPVADVPVADSPGSRADSLIGFAKRVALRVGAPSVHRLHAVISQRPAVKKIARVVYCRLPGSLLNRLRRIVGS